MTQTLEIISDWRYVADTVMGGVSDGSIRREHVAGRQAVRLAGQVSLDNNGGFIQMATDLQDDGMALDASGWVGLEIDLLGNGEAYNVHLRTTDLARPWQSFRQTFVANAAWSTERFAFAEFDAHRTDLSLNLQNLRRIGIVAIGREFMADVAVGGMRFYR